MKVLLTIEFNQPELAALEPEIRRAAQATLQAQPPATGGPVDLTIVISDDRQLQALNHEYLGIDAPTDVLAFPAGQTDPETEALYLGDVLISAERAGVQAAAGGHPLVAEIQLLVVHGVLHLLGYDHAEKDEKERMWAAQEAVLKNLGLNLSPP